MSLYLAGVLATGAPMRADRDGGATLMGAAAACVNCHRRSGLGSYEGSVLIPPIIGPYLFRDRATNSGDLTLPHIPGYTPNLMPYDEQSLALALRTGVAPGGRTLGALMPRYALDDASMADLIDYLRRLSVGPMPGVGNEDLDFATIVTPDTDPAERAAMLEVLEKFIKARNADIGPRVQTSHSSVVEYHASRNWRLHVWEPTGPAATWERQLHEMQEANPVFAVLSGLGRGNWEPVHSFCEHDRVPCVLPNVDLPVVAERDFYPLYFSRGVLLEADLIAARLTAHPPVRGSRLIQVYRPDDVGARGAAVLAKFALGLHLVPKARVLTARGARGISSETIRTEVERAVSGLRKDDTLALWIRPADIAALGTQAPPSRVYLSGLMASLEQAPLPRAWRGTALMTYPFDPPDLRRVRMNFPHSWFQSQGIRVTDDVLQTGTYVACTILAEVIDSMLDAYVPEFLVERMENMLDRRVANGYFPRLSLASGQRFASKGGYMVRFDGSEEKRVVVDGQWQVP